MALFFIVVLVGIFWHFFSHLGHIGTFRVVISSSFRRRRRRRRCRRRNVHVHVLTLRHRNAPPHRTATHLNRDTRAPAKPWPRILPGPGSLREAPIACCAFGTRDRGGNLVPRGCWSGSAARPSTRPGGCFLLLLLCHLTPHRS